MAILIKENENFSKMLKKAIASGAVAVIVGGGAMVPVYVAGAAATPYDESYGNTLQELRDSNNRFGAAYGDYFILADREVEGGSYADSAKAGLTIAKPQLVGVGMSGAILAAAK